nr:probable E3 ubiquitin-protein ligase RHY1A [Ipomoea batatas]GMD80155.1 probable E3 ubiquitin-protein ligase RHY1A [Ipomoea batatas]
MVMVALSTTQNAYADPDIFNFLKKVDDSIKPTKEYSISPKDFDMFGGDVQFQSRKLMGSGLTQAYHDEMMGEVAREAKQRLDEKLRARWKPDHKRNGNRPEMGILKRVDLGLKNTGLNKLCCATNSGLQGLRNLEK